MNKQEVKKHINDVWVCLRKNNQTIPDDLLDDFKLILEKFYSDDAPNAIVPQASIEFCSAKTQLYLNEQMKKNKANKDIQAEYQHHIDSLAQS